MSKEDLRKAHKEITDKMEKDEDENSYEKFQVKPAHVLAGGAGAFLVALLLSFMQHQGVERE